MNVLSRVNRALLTAVVAAIAVAALILPLVTLAGGASTRNDALAVNTSRASAYGDLFSSLYTNELRSARQFAAYLGQQGARSDLRRAFEHSVRGLPTSQVEVTGAYLFDPNGLLRAGYTIDAAHVQRVPAAPTGLWAGSHTALGRALASALNATQDGQALSFARGTGQYGADYLFEPVQDSYNSLVGALVLRVDNNIVARHYLGQTGLLLVAPPFVIGSATPGLTARHSVEVLNGLPASVVRDPSILGGVTPLADTGLTAASAGTQGTFRYQGQDELGGVATLTGFPANHVVVYSAPRTFVAQFLATVAGPAGLLLLLFVLGGTAILVIYQENRVRSATAGAQEERSRKLTEDILDVSQALSAARDGDLTVEVPNAESEVGLIAVMINGLLDDYGRMVGGIMHASQTVQDGATRVDDGVRSVGAIAAQQSTEIALTAETVGSLAASALAVQEATHQATGLAAVASRSVQQGQEAVGRIGEAVDSIKEAAIGTTREFKRLQEDSIRLTALVSSVKSNAENLDMQAANATLEARHLGTETGSAFAANIGRLARQAQETLADAETAVRSVVGSIDAVNRRIERISEQVRRGVEEVRAVRSTFEDITTTNGSLVQFIDRVAGSAQEQAGSAQEVARSIVEITTVFRQFNDLLVASGDEMANMRLVIADLQQSVADLTVAETAGAVAPPTERAA